MDDKSAEPSRQSVLSTYRRQHSVNRRIAVVKELAEEIRNHAENLSTDIVTTPGPPEIDQVEFYDQVRQFQIALIEDALIRTRGHQLNAARFLGLKATTLNNLMKRYDISQSLGKSQLS